MWKITKTQEEKEHERLDKEMIAFYKILPLDQKKRANLALVHGRIEALEQTTIIPKQTTKIVESCEAQESTATEQITSATKLKVESDVFRYFLQDDSKKGICSAQIKRICGKKAIWKRSLSGKKNQYVSGIEGMESDEVDKVMAQFKNLETYFVKSPYKAKIWKRQI